MSNLYNIDHIYNIIQTINNYYGAAKQYNILAFSLLENIRTFCGLAIDKQTRDSKFSYSIIVFFHVLQ